MKEFFSYYPNRLGYKVEYNNKKSTWREFQTNKETTLKEIYKNIDLFEKVKVLFGDYGEVGLSFAFTPHGAEIKIAFDNVDSDGSDTRFEINSAEGTPFYQTIKTISSTMENKNFPFIAGGIFFLLALAGAIFFIRRK